VRKAVVRGALEGGGTWDLPVAFREALASPRDAWSAIKTAIMRRPPERPVEELEIELIGLSAESGKQASMFEGKGKLWQQVQEAVRQLETQHDRPSIGKVIALDPRGAWQVVMAPGSWTLPAGQRTAPKADDGRWPIEGTSVLPLSSGKRLSFILKSGGRAAAAGRVVRTFGRRGGSKAT
jgi:hypothetical protein